MGAYRCAVVDRATHDAQDGGSRTWILNATHQCDGSFFPLHNPILYVNSIAREAECPLQNTDMRLMGNGTVVYVATRPITPGDEVFADYGSTSGLSSHTHTPTHTHPHPHPHTHTYIDPDLMRHATHGRCPRTSRNFLLRDTAELHSRPYCLHSLRYTPHTCSLFWHALLLAHHHYYSPIADTLQAIPTLQLLTLRGTSVTCPPCTWRACGATWHQCSPYC